MSLSTTKMTAQTTRSTAVSTAVDNDRDYEIIQSTVLNVVCGVLLRIVQDITYQRKLIVTVMFELMIIGEYVISICI